MATEFNDAQHWGIFTTGQTLTSSTGKMVRQSELVLAALRAQGVFDIMEDGTTAPAIDKLWLDKISDPAVLKEWDSISSTWQAMTFDRLFGRATVTDLINVGGTANAITCEEPSPFMDGKIYGLIPIESNTGATTIQVAGVGTYDVVYPNGDAIAAGELAVDLRTPLLFANGRFEIIFGANAGSIKRSEVDASSFGFVLDEDDMASDSAQKVPTQQSVKAYVDANASGSVADRTALKAVDTTKHAVAYLLESGREGTFQWDGSDLSAKVTADTAEGIYVAPASDATGASGAWVRQYSGLADVRWFGAALDNTTDDTDAFNVALSVAKDVFFPEGPAYITDLVQVPNDGNLIGEGVARSRFSLKADFNMAAEAVVKMGTSENQSFIDKIGFEFVQPSDGVRANLNAYPPAIGHKNIPRVRIGHVRFSRAYDGIDASGNAGGATYDWIECGALNRGLYIDGALDTMNLGRFRFWPFGIGSSGDGGTGDIYRDGSTIAAVIGRCDGLAGEIQSFRGQVIFSANGAGSAPRHLTAIHLDGDGAVFKAYDGPLYVDFLYTSKDATAIGNSILLDGTGNPFVTIDSICMKSSEPSVGILVNAGSLDINGGLIDYRELAHEAALVQKGRLAIRNTQMWGLGTRTLAYVRGTAALGASTLVVQDCDWGEGTGTGDAIAVTSASVVGMIGGGNRYAGRTLAITSTAMIGRVDDQYRGYMSADASTTVRLPVGWSVSKASTGNYAITHNLGWTLSRQAVSITPQNNATDASAVVDQTNTTTNLLRVRTFSAGVAADLPFTFEMAHV